MAWIEDPANGVLLVRQAAGFTYWTLPGGKVRRGESLVKALNREVVKKRDYVSKSVAFWGCWTGAIKTQLFYSLPPYRLTV